MEHTLHQWYLPLWWTVWEFLIAFSEADCHRKIPLQSTGEKKSWWATRKHHRYYVNGHVNMYVNPCHPMCTHQTAIRARIKGAKPAAEPAGCGLRQPALSSPLCSPLWFLLQLSLLMSLPASDGPWWTLGGVQPCRVGHQTGSHSLCGSGCSHEGPQRSKEETFKVLVPDFFFFF